MKLIIKNTSSNPYIYVSNSLIIPAEQIVEIAPNYWFDLFSDIEFRKDLRLNNLTISDGIQFYDFPESEEYIKYLNDVTNYNNRDPDGALVVRTKAAKKGWSFWAVPIEITTSTISGSVYCKLSNEQDISGISCKIYDSDNQEITTPGPSDVNLQSCVKTIVDFEPPFDYEVIGGDLRVSTNPVQDVRLWIIGAPDIPAQFGGSKEFVSGLNLKFLSVDSSFSVDGRVTKFLKYDPVTHQSKLRLLIKHSPGAQINMQFVLHLYRQ